MEIWLKTLGFEKDSIVWALPWIGGSDKLFTTPLLKNHINPLTYQRGKNLPQLYTSML